MKQDLRQVFPRYPLRVRDSRILRGSPSASDCAMSTSARQAYVTLAEILILGPIFVRMRWRSRLVPAVRRNQEISVQHLAQVLRSSRELGRLKIALRRFSTNSIDKG